MYVYKLTDWSGTFIGSSEKYPSSSDMSLSKQAAKMNHPKLEVLHEGVSKNSVGLVEFGEAINEVLSSDTYNLLNGRFHDIEPVMKYLGRHFILVIVYELLKKVYATTTYNPVDKLYRVFVSHRGRAELVDDIRNSGKDNFTVDIISTFDNPYCELFKTFEYYADKGYSFYNNGTYESLKSASKIVERLNNPDYAENDNDNNKELDDLVVPDDTNNLIVSKFDEPDDGSWLI